MARKTKNKKEVERDITGLDSAFGLLLEKAEDALPKIADGLAAMTILDLPYDSQEDSRNIGTTTRLQNWFETLPADAFPSLFEEIYRIQANKGHVYIFCDKHTEDLFKQMALDAGFTYGNTLMWDKKSLGMGHRWRSRHERILFMLKGKRPKQLNDKSAEASDVLEYYDVNDVLDYHAVRRDNSYPSEKPVKLMERLITNSTQPGDLVFSPFCGAAPCGEAALRHCRKYLGIDLSEEAINEHAMPRLCDIVEMYSDFFREFGFGEE